MTKLTYFTPQTRAGAALARPLALAASYMPPGCLRRIVTPLVALTRSTPRPRTRSATRHAQRMIYLLVGDGCALRVARRHGGRS